MRRRRALARGADSHRGCTAAGTIRDRGADGHFNRRRVSCCLGATLIFSTCTAPFPLTDRPASTLYPLPLSPWPLPPLPPPSRIRRPSFEPHRFADTWDDASPVARIERFFAGWFASCTASAFGLLPELIQSGRYDEVANLLQACDRSELHPSFETVATGGWKTNASFWDRAWRLARFSNRVSAGSLLSHCPSQTTEVPVLLVRTDADNRAQFLKRIAATCKVPTDTEARDFGCSAVFQGVLSVAIIPDLDHMAITTIGGKATARVIGEKLAAIDHR